MTDPGGEVGAEDCAKLAWWWFIERGSAVFCEFSLADQVRFAREHAQMDEESLTRALQFLAAILKAKRDIALRFHPDGGRA